MAQGKKISIQFQSTGIDDISKQLKQLQDEASKVVLTDNLDDQFSELVDKAKEVEEVLDELNKTFNSDNNVKKSKKTKQLTEMEAKIADVKKAVSSLTQQLGKAKTKVDQSVDRIDTAFQSINNQSFDGLLSQMQKVQNGFDDLIAKAKDYKSVLASEVQTVSSGKSKTKVTTDADEAQKELNYLKKRQSAINSVLKEEERNTAGGDKYLNATTRELNAVLNKFEDKIKEAQNEYQNAKGKDATQDALMKVIRIVDEFNSMYSFTENPTKGELFDKQNAYLVRLDDAFEEMNKSLLAMISNENRNDPHSYRGELQKELNKINARVAQLNSIVKKQDQEVKLDKKTLAEEVEDKITVRDIKKKTVELKVVVPEEEAKRAMNDVSDIVDKINSSPSSTVHLKLAFAGATKIKNYDKIIQTLADNISKVGDDPEAKEAVEKAVEKINSYFDAKLAIDTSDLDRIQKGVPAAMRKIRDQVAQDTLFLPVKLDPQDIQEQKKELEKELGTLTVPIGKIKVQDNLIDTGKLEKAAKKSVDKVVKELPTWNKIHNSMLESAKNEKLDTKTYKDYQKIVDIMKELGFEADKAEDSVKQMMKLVNNYVDASGSTELAVISKNIQNIGKQYEQLRKVREKANEEPKDAGEILQDNIIKFIQDVNKIPGLIREMKKQIGEVDIDGHVVVQKQQVQDALNELDDLELHIARLDIYKPTLDKIKLTVKEDLVGLAKAQKDLVKALNKFKERLVPDAEENGPSALEVKIQSLVDSINELGKYFVSIIQNTQSSEQVKQDKKAQAQTETTKKNQDVINSIVTEIKGISKKLDNINDALGQIYSKQSEPVQKVKVEKDDDKQALKDVYKSGEKPKAVVKNSNNETLDRLRQMTQDEVKKGISTSTKVTREKDNDNEINNSDYQIKIIGSLDELKQLVRNLDSNNPLAYGSLTSILKDWIKANEIMETTGDEKERLMLANFSKMMVSNPFVAGRYDSTSENAHNMLLNEFKEIVDLVIHSHPEKYAVQSPEDLLNVLEYRANGNLGAKSLVVAKNQMSLFDPSVMEELDIKPFAEEFEAKVKEFQEQVEAVSPNELIDPDAFQQLVQRALIETFNSFKGGKYANQMDNIFRTMSFNSADDISNDMFAGLVMPKGQIGHGTNVKKNTSARNNTYERLLKEFQDSKFKYLDNFATKKGLNDAGYSKLEELAKSKNVEFKTRKKTKVDNDAQSEKEKLAAKKEELRIDKERVQVDNERYKTLKAIEQAEKKQDDERVKQYNEQYKQQKAVEQAEKKRDNELVKHHNEEFKQQKAVQKAQEQAAKDQRKLSKAITKAEVQTASPYITEKDKATLEQYIADMKELKGVQGVTTAQIETAINNYEEAYIKADKGAKKYIEDLEKITKEQNKGNDSMYMPEYMQEASNMLSAVHSGNYNSQVIENFIAKRTSGENLRGNKASLENMMTKAEKMLSTNYLPGGLQSQLKDVISDMKALDSQTDISKASVYALADSFRKVEMEAAKAGKTFFGQVGQRLKDMNAKFIAQYFSIMDLIRYFRQMISVVTELDTALTEMRKVSDENIKSLKAYQKTTFDTAGALGTTAVQLQQSTADWLRLGESMDEAAKSAQAATMLFNVSEFENIGDATNALVAMSQAYKDLDKTEIIDVMNNIGNNYAIATDQLATALQASAASLMTQGNDLYQAAALVTAGNQIIQDASKTGTGLRTIALRIGGVKEGDDDIKAELEELGEEVDDWVVSTQAKKRQVIMDYTKVASNGGMGVDILDTNGNLKDTYTILLEIAEVYKEIQEEDKKYGTNRAKGLVEELAGKNRSNIAASILMNPQLLKDVYNDAMSSSGSAAEENAKYLDSIVGKTQQFKNELQELISGVLSSDVLKDVIDFGTNVLSIINQLNDKIPILTALVGSLIAGIVATKKEWVNIFSFDKDTNSIGFMGKFKIDYKSWEKFTAQLKVLKKNWYGIIPHIIEFPNKIKSFPATIKKMASDTAYSGKILANNLKNGFINNLKGIDFKNGELRNFFNGLNGQISFDKALDMSNLSKETKEMAMTLKTQGVTSWEAYATAEKSAGLAAQFTSTAVSILNSVVTAGISLLATLAISAAVKGIRKLANASKEAKEEFTTFNDALKETKEQVKSNKEYIDDNGKTYAKLAKEVDSLGNNLSLSTDEFEKYNELSNEIAERFPELVAGWTEEGNAILKVRDSVKELNDAYEENKKLKLERLIAGDEDINPKSVIKNYKQLKKANFFEMVASGFTHTKEAGKIEDYDYLDNVYSAFLKMSYEDYRKMYGYLEGDIKNLTEEEQQLVKSVTLGQNKKTALLGIDSTATEEEFEHARLLAQSQYDMMTEEMEEALRGYREIASTYLQLQPNYDSLDAQTKEIANKIINSLDQSLIDELQLDDPYKINAWVKQTLRSLDGLDKDVISDLFKVDTTDKNFKETVKESAEAYNKAIASIDAQISVSDDEYEIKRLTALKESLKEITGLADAEDFGKRFNNQLNSISNGVVSEYEILNNYTKDFTREQMENWLNVTDAEMSATEAIDAYENAIAKGTFSKFDGIGALLSQNTAIDDTSWKEIKNDLVGLAQAGKLDEQTLRDYKYFDEILKALGLTADVTDDQLSEMINDINKIAVKNAVDDLSNYKTEVDKLGDAYSKFKKGEFIDAGTLSALQDAFGDLDSYQAFEEAVLSGQTDLQHYFDNIVTEYANQHKILNELTDANKEWVKQQLVSSGITKESADAAVEDALKHKKALEGEVRAEIESLNSMDAIAKGKKELAIDTANLSKMTIQEVSALLAETQATGEGAEKIKFFAIEKELAKMTGIRNNDDIEYLIQLCELAGMGTSQLESLKRLGANSDKWDSQISEADSKLKKLGSRSDTGAVNERAYWNSVKQTAQNAKQKYQQGLGEALPNFRKEFYSKYKDFNYELNTALSFDGIGDAASEAGSEAAEAFKDALDKILAMYDAELDAGVITFQTYVDKSRQAIEQYYAEGKIKASEYYDYLANLYQKQVSEYDKVISAVQRLLKKQTDELQKQKEAIEESYNLQIEEIQKKIDALQDENDEIDKNMALQKAQ